MSIEEDHLDVLQNLEFIVGEFYRQNPDLTDFQVQGVYEAVTEHYRADERGSQPRSFALTEIQEELASGLKNTAEFRLGRATVEAEGSNPVDDAPPIDHATLIRCLRKLQKSLSKWSKKGGRQGYLNFISKFV